MMTDAMVQIPAEEVWDLSAMAIGMCASPKCKGHLVVRAVPDADKESDGVGDGDYVVINITSKALLKIIKLVLEHAAPKPETSESISEPWQFEKEHAQVLKILDRMIELVDTGRADWMPFH